MTGSSGSDAIRTGEASELAGDFLDATAAYQSALADADPLVVAEAHFRLGRVAWKQGRYEDAIEQYRAARGVAVQHGADELRGRIENGLGVVHNERGEFEQARATFAVALELAGDDNQRARVLLNLGVIANVEGDLDGARKHYLRSRVMFERAGNRRGEALALHNLGAVYADESLWDEAEESYRICLELLEPLGDRQMIAKVLLNRSEVSCARGRFDDAIASCDMAISIAAEIGDEVDRGEALRWKGYALIRVGQHAAAQKALIEAARIGARAQVKMLEAEASRDLAASLIETSDVPGARKRLQRALTLFEAVGAQREIAEVRAIVARLG